jgi:hypothetical protein
MSGDSAWGVSIAASRVTLFRGPSFAARNQNYDEIYTLSSAVSPSGLSEVVFVKATGTPQTTGTITLTANADATRTITINSQGMVAY